MADHKLLQGILTLVDIVNFTGQSDKIGDVNMALYTKYFQERIKKISEKQNFRVIKYLGDAALIFGIEPAGIIEIMLDLFKRDKPEDKYGFFSRFRMAAHSGFFQFKMENGLPTDLVSYEGIKVFRMEKYAVAGNMIITQALYQGLKQFITVNMNIIKLSLEEPLKGFDNEEWYPPFYMLNIKEKETGESNLLEQSMEKLAQDVQYIAGFGEFFQKVPMDINFIDLSFLHIDKCDIGKPVHDGSRHMTKEERDEKIDSDKRQKLSENLNNENTQKINTGNLYDEFNAGIILGLPGAGKTTILRFFAHRELKANKGRTPEEKHIVIFIHCCYLTVYDEWCRKVLQSDNAVINEDTALNYFTWTFLFGSNPMKELSPEEIIEFHQAIKEVKKAFDENRLTLLVDALDEAPNKDVKSKIIEILPLLISPKNRIFLSSRPSEYIYFKELKISFFSVQPLNMEQVRVLAGHLFAEDSETYKWFDKSIWEEEIVLKIAATPLMALLVAAYFKANYRFDTRFHMYDLLIKFILLNTWEKIKKGSSSKILEIFFLECKRLDFLQTYNEVDSLYEKLGSLCFNLIYDGAEGQIQYDISEDTLNKHFTASYYKIRIDNVKETPVKVSALIEWLKKDNMLLPTNTGKYTFIHFSVMEYLAAFHLIRKTNEEPGRLIELIKSVLKKRDFMALETIPTAVGYDIETGLDMLAAIRDLDTEEKNSDLLQEMGIRCLAELEWLVTKTIQSFNIESQRKEVLKIFESKKTAVDWLYLFLQKKILTKDKTSLNQDIDYFNPFLKLSMDTLFTKHLDYREFNRGDSELIEKRKELLFKFVQQETVNRWLENNREKIPEPSKSVLQLDSPTYHPEDKNFKYYRDITGKELKGFLGSPNLKHSESVRACLFSPDGRHILSASDDNTLKLWDALSGKEIRTFAGHEDSVYKCAFSPDGTKIISASRDKTLKLWNLSGKEIFTLRGHKNSVWSCAFSPDGMMVLSGSSDTTLKLWDITSGKEIRSFDGHNGTVLCCAFAPDGKSFLSASNDRKLILWDIDSGKELRTFLGHKGDICACRFSPDGKKVLSSSSDMTVKLWDIQSGVEIHTFTAHTDSINSFTFTPDGKSILTASADKSLKLWDIESRKEISTLCGHKGSIKDAAISPDGNTIISAAEDNTLKLWDIKTGREKQPFSGHTGHIYACSLSPDGKMIVSASRDQTLKIWDMESGNEIHTIPGHESMIEDCAFSTDGNRIVSVSADAKIKIWNRKDYKEIRELTGHKDAIHTCALSPDGKSLITGSSDKTIKLWDIAKGTEIYTFSGHTRAIYKCAFSPDGTKILSGSADETIRLWDTATGKEINKFQGNRGVIYCCVFSPDGKRILSAMDDNTLVVWDIAGNKEIHTMSGHMDYVSGCIFSTDGEVILSASADRTIKLWETNSGKLMKSVGLPWKPFSISLWPSHPGMVVTANRSGTLTIFAFEELQVKNNPVDSFQQQR